MCSGRIDPAFVIRSFYNGADGVYIAGCRLNECNYITHGNFYALNMTLLCKRLMEFIGLNRDRLRIEFMTSSEGQRFAETVNDFTKKIRDLGPIGEGEGLNDKEVKLRLYEITKLIPYIKIAMKNKLSLKIDDPSQWDTLFTKEEVESLIKEAPSYYIDPEKCVACTLCAQRCPVNAIDGGKNRIHIINQETCIRCGTCLEVCPSRFSAVKKIINEPVPPPIPEEKRTIIRKGVA